MADPAAKSAAPTTAPTSAPTTAPSKTDVKLTHVAGQYNHTSPFISCRYDPTGKFLFATAEDRSIQRWEPAGGKQVGFSGHDSWVRGLAFSNDGKTLITGGYDGRLIWWPADSESPKPIRTVEAHNGWVRYLCVSPDGKTLASSGNDNLVKLWNLADGTKLHEMTGHESHVYSVRFHPVAPAVISGELRGKVNQYESETAKLVRSFDAKKLHTYNGGQQVDFGGVRDIAFSKDGKLLACAGLYKAENPLGAVSEPLVLLFEYESQKLVQSLTTAIKGVAWRVIFHPDGFLVVASGGGGGGFLLFYKSDQPAEFHKFQMPNTIRDMDLHPDGIQIATAYADNQIRISRMAAKA